MKKDGTYRFCLQFKPLSEDDVRVGEFLERLGNKKSKIVITALLDYLEKNPEPESETYEVRIETKSVSRTEMEAMVRRMIEERLGVAPIDGITENSISEPQNVENDILSMLDDLSLFDMN